MGLGVLLILFIAASYFNTEEDNSGFVSVLMLMGVKGVWIVSNVILSLVLFIFLIFKKSFQGRGTHLILIFAGLLVVVDALTLLEWWISDVSSGLLSMPITAIYLFVHVYLLYSLMVMFSKDNI